MSIEEYEAYRSGLMLQNTTDHYRGGLGGSLSRGFCFFSGNVARWAQRLNGLVSFDVLLTVEVSPEAFMPTMLPIRSTRRKEPTRSIAPRNTPRSISAS